MLRDSEVMAKEVMAKEASDVNADANAEVKVEANAEVEVKAEAEAEAPPPRTARRAFRLALLYFSETDHLHNTHVLQPPLQLKLRQLRAAG